MKPTLKQFAEDAGVIVIPCGPGWGGKYGYKTRDCPDVTFNGYKTKQDAYRAWARDTFGEKAGEALIRLLTPNTHSAANRQIAPPHNTE